MKDTLVKTRNTSIKLGYNYLLKPILFQFDAEDVHDRFTKVGEKLGSKKITRSLTNSMFNYSNKSLNQNIIGINFANPVGLAAGFDKDARLVDIIPHVGFGFQEIGSITGQKCAGNPRPRLWRLKKSKSLVVYYGLKNDGAQTISLRLQNKNFSIPIFTSIAKTNSKNTVDMKEGINDYVKAYDLMKNIGSASVINVSCPNAFGGQPFHDKKRLDLLLKEIVKIKSSKPIFLKISPDLTKKQIDDIINLSLKYKIKGLICSNLTKDKINIKLNDSFVPEVGGISGKPLEDLSNELIKYVYKKSKGKLIIIGVGGIFTAQDAYKKIKCGASLVQLITGMIFVGPQVISEINQGLVKLLKKDGYSNISQAIGKDVI